MDQNLQQKSMSDAVGATVVVGDHVAFYNAEQGRTIFGKILKFNSSSMSIQPDGRRNSVRKISTQVLKVLIEFKKIIFYDALGNEIKVGDFVAMTPHSNTTNTRRFYGHSGYPEYSGKIIFGEIKNLKKTSVDIRVVGKNKLVKKHSNQIVKVSEEQMTLILFSM